MLRHAPLLTCLLVALALPGCKIVKTLAEGDVSAAAQAGESGDDARIAALLDETFAAKLLPHVAETAMPLADLRTALAGGLDAAGAAHGQRGAGHGAAWNFAVKGEGKVISANLTSRARKAELDTDGDGAADVTLQLGPVIKGTALRDVAPFYDFNNFRDQIEFAKLARAINDRVSAGLTVPEGDITGKTLAFTGAIPLKKADEALVVTVLTLEARP